MQEARPIEGWFLTFTKEERELVEQAFEDLGYELSAQGIKQYVLDTIEAMEDDRPGAVDKLVENIAGAINKNPEAVRTYASLAGSMLMNFLNAKKKAAAR